jgi:NAD(P)-dependent dehydrogenase (short-subunit alcohol dehydrogenase family)
MPAHAAGFLDVMLANPRKLEYILGRIPLGGWVQVEGRRLGRERAAVAPGRLLHSWPMLSHSPSACVLSLSLHPPGRLGIAEDMVGPCLFLSSHASDYVTGAEIAVDGGGAALPMLAEQNTECYNP